MYITKITITKTTIMKTATQGFIFNFHLGGGGHKEGIQSKGGGGGTHDAVVTDCTFVY